ncbi:hypothetical protein [Halalkalibacter oceani]|uniref:hypothetical protein n=1 Tax=Halalkalibacter oceani TaxID=1653776 RepID=UPI003394973F
MKEKDVCGVAFFFCEHNEQKANNAQYTLFLQKLHPLYQLCYRWNSILIEGFLLVLVSALWFSESLNPSVLFGKKGEV